MSLLNFEQRLNGISNITINHLDDYLNVYGADIDTVIMSTVINYQTEIDIRDWGIDGMYTNVTKIGLYIEWDAQIADLTDGEIEQLLLHKGIISNDNETIEGIIDMGIVDDKEWTITTEIDISNGQIDLSDMDVNFKEKTVLVQ